MKTIVLMSLVLLAAFSSKAQKIKFGAKLGANFYSVTGSDADETYLDQSRKTKVGIAGGAMVNIPLSSMFSIQPEMLYSMEGNLQKEGDVKDIINLSYLNVPVMAQLNTASGFYGETGPQIGILLSAKRKYKIGSNESQVDIKDELKGLAFSWAIGAGYKMKCGLGIGARYNFGLSSLDNSTNPYNTKSSGMNVGVFYLMGIDKGAGKKK